MISLFLSFFYFLVPIALLVFFVASLVMFCRAKAANKRAPGTYTEEQVRTRLLLLIISSCVAGVMLLCVLGLIALMFMAVAYM